MDQVKFSTNLGENEELTDTIVWPSINFNSKKIYYAEFIINNDGFYIEDYEIDYSYSTTFVESIDGPNLVTINAGESLTVE